MDNKNYDLGLVSKEIIDRWNELLYKEESICSAYNNHIVSSYPIIHHNSLIDSDEFTDIYNSEFVNPLFDESDSIVPLTSPVKLFSHVTEKQKTKKIK